MLKSYLRGFSILLDTDSASGEGSSGEDAGTSIDMDSAIMEAQGLESVSDADLMGAPDESDDTSGSDESKETEDDKSDASDDKSDKEEDADKDDTKDDKKESETESTSKDDSASSESEKSQSPPKGHVPLAALKEARSENTYLKAQLVQLNKRLDTIAKGKPDADSEGQTDKAPDDFKVLSKDEYTKLVEDDPSAALVYQHDLINYRDAQRAEADAEAEAEYDAEETQSILDSTVSTMEELVPGIFDENSDAHEELVEFASDLGFADDMFYLTNPATQIILPGQSEPLLLGDQAASILKVLITAKTKIGEASKAVDVEALTASIRKDVESELLTKFKKETGKKFKSLTSVPKSESNRDFAKTDNLTEAQLLKLSPEEQEAYLAGT